MTTDGLLRDYPFETFHGELPLELLGMVQTRPVSPVRLPDGRPAWLVVGYDDVRTVLADPRFSRRSLDALEEQQQCPVGHKPPRELGVDNAERLSLRRLGARAFTPRQMQAYRPRVQAIADRLLDEMEASGKPADLISSFVAPLPKMVICDMLAVPREDLDLVLSWANELFSVTAYGSASAERAWLDMRAYLAARLEAKKAEPGDDLFSAWLALQATEEITDEEIVGLSVGALLGGLEISTISVGVRALFQHPEQMAALRADPSKLGSAIDEILRYTSVSPMFIVHTAVEDVELGGELIRRGDAVMAVPWAANRQPERFADPHVFDIDRKPNPHLTFGHGPHYCLGASLGWLEVEIGISTLLERYPDLAPAEHLDELAWRKGRSNSGIESFLITW